MSNLNNGQTTEESLAYLFDQSEQIDATTEDGTPTGTLGKKTYWDVGGLLQIDRDGYYYYNADYSKSKVAGGSYQSANYAYFDEGSKTPGASRRSVLATSRASSSPLPIPPPQTSSL